MAKENKPKIIPKVKGFVDDYRFVESVFVDSEPAFLVKDIKSGKVSVEHEIKVSEKKVLRPLYLQEYGYKPFFFTRDEIARLNSTDIAKAELIDEIMTEVKKYVVVDPRDQLLISGEILLTYCQEWISTVHYPFFVGETESGKSSVLYLGTWLDYRCIISEDLPHADIYNFLGTEEEGAGTICEDEAQEMARDREKIRTYKASYAKGSTKPRVIMTSNGKWQVFYKTFCCKWFAGESVPQDKGFLERVVIVYMLGGSPESNIKKVSAKEKIPLQKLRNRLLFWKLQNIGKEFPSVESGLERRDQELWEDFLSVFAGTRYEEAAKDTAKFYLEQRHQTIKESMESLLFRILKPAIEEQKDLSSDKIWELVTNSKEIPGTLDERTGKSFYPDEMEEKITPNSISKILRFKFQAKRVKKTRVVNGKSVQTTYYLFDGKILEILSKRYKINEEK